MITVEKSFDGRIATVRGTPLEVMLFYCVWQSFLWPEWFKSLQHECVRQQKYALKSSIDGVLELHDAGIGFEKATIFTIERCRLLGIEVQA